MVGCQVAKRPRLRGRKNTLVMYMYDASIYSCAADADDDAIV
jgi:hypothetical protein